MFIDCGARIGGWSIPAAFICKQVYAFEPNKSFAQILRRNAAINDLTNIQVINKVVWNEDAEVVYDDWIAYENMTDHELSRLSKQAEELGGQVKTTHMEGITLDTFCLSEGIVPTFIKIDVEGEEMRVIHGAQWLIGTYKPRLLVEAHKEFEQRQVGKLIQYILELNHTYNVSVTSFDGVNMATTQMCHLYFS